MTQPFKLPETKWPGKVERDAVDKLIEPTPVLFEPTPEIPESVLLSIYNAYPRRTGRPAALKRIREALDRICGGEIDGAPRTQAEAIEFLRTKVEEARVRMGAREQKFIPHMATWLHQRRYLRVTLAQAAEMPKRLKTCVRILALYPKMPGINVLSDRVAAFVPALNAIDKALERMEENPLRVGPVRPEERAEVYLSERTALYRDAVSTWPAEDLQFVPRPEKWYSECRYEQPEESWKKKTIVNYETERNQILRIAL